MTLHISVTPTILPDLYICSVPVFSVYLHGEQLTRKGDVDVVWPHGKLWGKGDAGCVQGGAYHCLNRTHAGAVRGDGGPMALLGAIAKLPNFGRLDSARLAAPLAIHDDAAVERMRIASNGSFPRISAGAGAEPHAHSGPVWLDGKNRAARLARDRNVFALIPRWITSPSSHRASCRERDRAITLRGAVLTTARVFQAPSLNLELFTARLACSCFHRGNCSIQRRPSKAVYTMEVADAIPATA